MSKMGAAIEGMLLAEEMRSIMPQRPSNKPVTTAKMSSDYNALCTKRRKRNKSARKQRRLNRK